MGRKLGTKPMPYKRFAVMPQDYSESEKYWLVVYKDEVPELTINTDFKRGQKQSFNGSAVYDTVDIELHKQIQEYCKGQNITPYVFYMAAFNILLSKFSGCEDIVVGMPIGGRDGKFLDTIGMFVNTIALRNKPTGTKSITDFLQEVKENRIAAIEHQDYPYGNLVKKLGLNISDRNPLFDVMFAYQSEEMTDVVFGDEKAELMPVPITKSKYDFTLNVMPRENDVVVMVEYCTDLYKWYSLMQKEKQRRVDRFRFADDKKRTVAGEMLARKAIAEWCNTTPEEVHLYTKENGKPCVKGLPVEFNISHSADMVVCAVDNAPVGIDIEKIRPVDLSIAKRICSFEEMCYLFGHDPEEQDFVYTTNIDILARFFEIWAIKETYIKCCGIITELLAINSHQCRKSCFFVDINGYICCIYHDVSL